LRAVSWGAHGLHHVIDRGIADKAMDVVERVV
jgi:hypothetical protein